MSRDLRPLAIIPARGGSKRIPRKNVRPFLGKPIIRYAIEAALKSGVFAQVMVSTDDPKIAAVAERAGAVVPFLRSRRNSNDQATIGDAVIEVLDVYEKAGRPFDYFACIMATAALVTPESLRKADAMMRKHDADSVVAVTRFGFPIQRALKARNGKLSAFTPKHFFERSQDLEPAFHDCGQFFFCRTARMIADKRALSAKTYALEIPESPSSEQGEEPHTPSPAPRPAAGRAPTEDELDVAETLPLHQHLARRDK